MHHLIDKGNCSRANAQGGYTLVPHSSVDYVSSMTTLCLSASVESVNQKLREGTGCMQDFFYCSTVESQACKIVGCCLFRFYLLPHKNGVANARL